MSDSPTPPSLQPADLVWIDGSPTSGRFGDLYYSREDGRRESGHVFLDGNGLAERWSRLAPGDHFTLAETGFGTGLNFLCALSLWLERSPPGTVLHFLSLEKYPLAPAQLRQALGQWPQLAALAEELLAVYPPLLPGFHRRWLCDARVCLTLVFDDATRGLEQLRASDHPQFAHRRNFTVDAWFLDGFAPTSNPELWSAELFRHLAALSRAGTTAATFTVARRVRDGLSAAGFELARKPGFGRKRHMLTALFSGCTPERDPHSRAPRTNRSVESPWYLTPQRESCPREALIVGGGIAGCATAAALERRGWRVRIVERHGELAPEASGNPQGILYPRLSVEDSPLALFARHCLNHALGFYRPFWQDNGDGDACGVVVLPENEKQWQQFPRIAERHGTAPDFVTLVRGKALSTLVEAPLAANLGLFFPTLGWVSPPAVCRWLAGDIERIQGAVAEMVRDDDGCWTLLDGNREALGSAPVVVLCAGQGSAAFPESARLPLRVIRGQISRIPATAASSRLRTVLCGKGYLAPARDGSHTAGATYDLDDPDTEMREEDHLRNLATLSAIDPVLQRLLETPELRVEELGGRAALRCNTPDYLPLAGPLPDADAMAERFEGLRRDARADIPDSGCYHEGLWVNCGHGSRGLTYAPLAAELVASRLSMEPPPLPRALAQALHPARFLIRALKRNQL